MLVVALALGLLQPVVGSATDRPEPQDSRLDELSIEQLLDVEIVSASNVAELLSEAPATVIVISRQEILDRGYAELTEILDDLPGMEVIRPYGATYFKNYWRGYRNTIGDPFLLMVDGIILNNLYYNTADIMATLPLAHVERVEVVYGPASSVYGANAFMGVINVITLKEQPDDGSSQRGFLAAGSRDSRIADLGYFYQKDRLRLSVAARFEDSDLDDGSNNLYEYTSDRYYGDRRLWGGFLDNPELGGRFSSPRRHRAADLRLFAGDLEIGLQYLELETGYGLEYAADRAQAHAVWSRPELSVHARTTRRVSDRVISTTLLRYRTSEVSNDSYWLEGKVGDDGQRLVSFSYWQSLNSSWSLFQDFELQFSERFEINTGVKYEQKRLQKAYDINYGPWLPPSEVDAATYPYPAPPSDAPLGQNSITTEDAGLYVHARYRLGAAHGLHLGARYDDNSVYGGATTFRSGWVGSIEKWTVKALYGEAFQEPTPRVLYGGWTGSGSDPTLDPERSRTVELSLGRSARRWSTLASAYWVENDDTIVNTSSGARNLGQREVIGFDLHAHALLRPPAIDELRLWGYYSRLLEVDERKLGTEGEDLGTGRIGDLADDKLMVGATARLTRWLSTSLRARHVGSRPTVDTNPVGVVPSFTTVDFSITVREILGRGLSASLRVTNLLDEEYLHPGVREADAGLEPGSFDEDGQWHGSQGWYSSALAQPGRAALLVLGLDL